MQTCDVAVLGAGIIGAACAFELACAGLRVTIVESNAVAAGATNAGQGHLLVLDDSPAQFALSRFSMQLWQPLLEQLPDDCEYWRCGTVWVALDDEELDLAAQRARYYDSNGVHAQLLLPGQLTQLEPNLRPGLAGGLLVPGDASVRPGLAAQHLCSLAQQRGAKLLENTHVVHVVDSCVTFRNGEVLWAGSIINATGTAAPSLTPSLPIRPRKGHILVVDAGPAFANHEVMELGYIKSAHAANETDSVAFNVRHNRAGELLLGSSRQYASTDPQVEPRIIAWMLRRALEFMPGLADAKPIRSWTGFRAGTPDGLPLIGLCTGFDRVFAATGHEGLGATTAPGTARLLADHILARTPEIDPTPYLPSRFERNQV